MNAEKGDAISKQRPASDAGRSNLITLSLRTRLVPQEGWITFLLLMALLISVVWSVQQADWVATDNLIAVVFWAALAGLILAKLKAPWPLLHLAGVVIGFIVVMWQTAGLTEAESIVLQVQEAWTRVTLWTNAALKGGISTDLLPFSLLLFIFGWLVAYLSSWFIFRSRNVWVAILLPGIGMLTNLSYLPDPFAGHFFFFLFLAMLLVVRMTMLQRISTWNRSRITFNNVRTWFTLNEAVWFGLAVVLIVALLPLKAVSPPQLRSQWEEMRSPARRLEDEFARLFSGLPARKTIPVRIFGPSLAFQGKIALSGVPALWVNSDYPSYWFSHTYDSYIAQGWVSSANHKLDIEPDGNLVSPQPYKGQITVSQSVKVGFSSDAAFLGGDLVHVDRKIQVKTLTEPTQTTNTKSTEVPIALDIVAARFSKRLNPNDAYNLDSSVSLATDSELRRTGTDYPEWIKTYYLQLPGSLPDRVKVLAREVTR
ncbi:MAG: hypothetical protein HY666_01860, partial [Chloroflexi bacterium]|nr:hypothetical protein [Chloroflexota bacterium]